MRREKTVNSGKEACVSAKQPQMAAKELYIPAKEPYMPAKEPDPYICRYDKGFHIYMTRDITFM